LIENVFITKLGFKTYFPNLLQKKYTIGLKIYCVLIFYLATSDHYIGNRSQR